MPISAGFAGEEMMPWGGRSADSEPTFILPAGPPPRPSPQPSPEGEGEPAWARLENSRVLNSIAATSPFGRRIVHKTGHVRFVKDGRTILPLPWERAGVRGKNLAHYHNARPLPKVSNSRGFPDEVAGSLQDSNALILAKLKPAVASGAKLRPGTSLFSQSRRHRCHTWPTTPPACLSAAVP